MRIVFMGTPDFAVPCLEKILADGHEVPAAFTQPDKPVGRHATLTPPPVKQLALSHGIPVYQPTKMRDGTVAAQLQALAPDCLVVVAYGRILPQAILDVPPKGCINIHGSLLPKYRGAAPIQWSVINGEAVTGVTSMYMDAGMDTGDIIDTITTPIGENETAGELFERLAPLGAELLGRTLHAIENGTAGRTPQDAAKATYAPMLDRSMSPIDWTQPAQWVIDQVRGLIPWPVATAELAGTAFKIFRVENTDQTTDKAPGTVLGLDKKGLLVACGEGGVLRVTQLQAQGGRRMAAADYFRGHPLEL